MMSDAPKITTSSGSFAFRPQRTLPTVSCFHLGRHLFLVVCYSLISASHLAGHSMSTTRLISRLASPSSRLLLSARLFPRCSTQLRFSSSSSQDHPPPPRPYQFHVAVSWAGKPIDPRERVSKTTPFSHDSEIGTWRDHSLARQSHISGGTHIGEDFFYVQDVSESRTSQFKESFF